MAEFHKKECEELEKEHDKVFELLDEDRIKVNMRCFVRLSCVLLGSTVSTGTGFVRNG